MAQINSSDGVPSVQPQTSVPDDYEHIQSSPADFGGAIGQGAERLGAGAAQAGKFWGQIQTDGSLNDANGQALDVVKKFTDLKGQDALDAQKDTMAAVDKAYNERRSMLGTAEQQFEFDQQSRSFRQRFLEPQIYNHATQQGHAYATTVNSNRTKSGMDLLASLDPTDPNYEGASQAALHMVIGGAVRNAHLNLGDDASPEDVEGYVRPYLQGALKTQAQVMAVKDPKGASEFLDKHREQIGVDYAALSSQFRARANEQDALGIADGAFSTTAQTIQNAPGAKAGTMAVREAILQQESGGNNAALKSANGAVGPGQVMEATFKQYARPGEDIANPADNRAVSARIVDDLSEKYGGDPTRIAVGYFSGPGNVAPAGSATPWLADLKDANGKSVSSYVQDVTQRLGTQGPMLAARAGVYDTVLAKTEGNPILRQAALREVDQRYRAAEISDLQDQKARKAATDGALRQYGDSIRAGSPDFGYRRDPNLTEEQVEHLEKLQKDTLKETIDGSSGNYGPGYADIQSRILDPSAPVPIRSREQLLQEFGKGNINPAGLEQAGKWLDWSNKPDNIGDRVLTENFYKSARKAVTLMDADMKNAPAFPGGEDNWNKALPVLNKALDAGRAKGLSTTQMMDPNDKDSVWPLLKPFLPSRAAALAYNINQGTATSPDAAAPDLTTAAGIKAAVALGPDKGGISREDGIKRAVDAGFIAAPAPQVPQGD